MREKVKVGALTLGDGRVYIQSMLNKPAAAIEESIAQAKALERAGCDIIRTAVPEKKDAVLVARLKESVDIPVVADIHFDYRIALEAVAAGADKIRINPGNIGGDDRVKAVVEACRGRGIPIRIGVNSGSLEKELLHKYGHPTPEALVESALGHARLLERYDFYDTVISIKSSNVALMIAAYRRLFESCAYPLHLGVTEAGTERIGLLKSAVGIGSLLCDGIGDTIRVSLTADPLREVIAAQDILHAIGKSSRPEIISCPTCGRTKIDVQSLAERLEDELRGFDKPLKIAVMGCAVNGPGEAREADLGIAGGNGEGILFKKGEIVAKIPEEDLLEALLREIRADPR